MYTLDSAVQLRNRLAQLQREIDSVRLAECTFEFNFYFVLKLLTKNDLERSISI